jgi:hypothetical protein
LGVHQTGVLAASSHECLIEFTVFCAKKTIDGEQFLKRIQVSHWRLWLVRLSATDG